MRSLVTRSRHAHFAPLSLWLLPLWDVPLNGMLILMVLKSNIPPLPAPFPSLRQC